MNGLQRSFSGFAVPALMNDRSTIINYKTAACDINETVYKICMTLNVWSSIVQGYSRL